MNEKKDGVLFHYDGKAWTASLVLAGLSVTIAYVCMSVLQLAFWKTAMVLVVIVIPLGYLYNWYARRRGGTPLWSIDILLNLLPLDFMP